MGGITNERQLVLKDIIELLNNDRINKKMKPLSVPFYAVKMSHLSVQDLYYLLSSCKQSDNFGKCWWGSLKSSN